MKKMIAVFLLALGAAGWAQPVYPSGDCSSSTRRHSPNYTEFSSQRNEYFNTHKLGRVFDLQSGQYVTGQENRVYVDAYQRKDGGYVNRHTRSYPSTSSPSGARTTPRRSGPYNNSRF